MKRSYIWIISLIVLGGLVFGYWSISNRAYSAENALEASYQRGFYNLLEQVNDLNLMISKSEVTSSDEQRIMLLTTIWHRAEGARASLSTMPLGNRDLTNLHKFFAQLGDFSYSIADKLVKKQEISEKEWANMEQFRKNIQDLNQELRRLQDEASAGKIKWGNQNKGFIKVNKVKGVADGFETIDQKLKNQAPTITYDGPFSDHIADIKPKAVTGERIEESEAIRIAESFLGEITKGDFTANVARKSKGNLPSYTIEFTRPGNNIPDIIMDISEIGGHIIWFLNTRTIENSKIPIKQAMDKARAFLESTDYKGMESTGSLRENNTLTVTFVPKEQDVLLYPDYVKVEVALDNGEIVGFNTVAYLISHTERDFPESKFTEEEILDRLNKKLQVKRVRMALIPDDAKREKLCYEIDAQLNNDRFFIYVNAENGNEEQILKIVETDKGTMTM
ncbi:MAG: germination protein YpeB [Tepidanaerobacteraceae bacterium]|nr:germination protein YpeB [Thermoanaerobacterales bacterium]